MFAMLAELDSGDDDSDQGLDRICPEPQQKTKIAQKETTQQRQAQPKEKKKFQKFSVELQVWFLLRLGWWRGGGAGARV